MSGEAADQGSVQIALRLAPDLRERIKAAAEANNRSVNRELRATLEEKYPPPVSALRGDIQFLKSEIKACSAHIDYLMETMREMVELHEAIPLIYQKKLSAAFARSRELCDKQMHLQDQLTDLVARQLDGSE